MSILKYGMMIKSHSSGGGGGGDTTPPPILQFRAYYTNVDSTTSGPDTFITYNGYVEFIDCEAPYDMTITLYIQMNWEYEFTTCEVKVSKGTSYIEFECVGVSHIEGVWQIDEDMAQVMFITPYDLNYRIIPEYIYAEEDENWNEIVPMGQYIYACNIDYIPESPDDMGSVSEVCPEFMMGSIGDGSYVGNWIWYKYNGEILFRNTLYSNQRYALTADGIVYQYS